jgi:FAD:protein FMN transferase
MKKSPFKTPSSKAETLLFPSLRRSLGDCGNLDQRTFPDCRVSSLVPRCVPRNDDAGRLLPVSFWILFCCAFLVVSGCRSDDPVATFQEVSGDTMGTIYHIKAGQPLDEAAVHVLLTRLDKELFSTYAPDSELSRFNRATAGEDFSISSQVANVFSIALSVSEASGGAFDVTVGPLVNAWGFGPDAAKEPPDAVQIEALSVYVGYEKLVIDVENFTLSKTHDGLYADLSAVAKGYAVDAVASYLTGQGVTDYMVEIGGEVRTAGVNAQGDAWRIGIEKPTDTGQSIQEVVSISGQSLATSGDYRNFFLEDGKRRSHTIDPRTSRPVEHDLASVSVLHRSCAWADAYATALMVLGPEEGFRLAEDIGLAVYFIIRDPEGGFRVKATPSFLAACSPADVGAAATPATSP